MAMILFFIGDLLTLQVQLLMLNILLIACLFCFLKLDLEIRFSDRFKKIENGEIGNANFEEPSKIEIDFESGKQGIPNPVFVSSSPLKKEKSYSDLSKEIIGRVGAVQGLFSKDSARPLKISASMFLGQKFGELVPISDLMSHFRLKPEVVEK